MSAKAKKPNPFEKEVKGDTKGPKAAAKDKKLPPWMKQKGK